MQKATASSVRDAYGKSKIQIFHQGKKRNNNYILALYN